MTVYTFALPKGGTGKSSTAADLVIELADRGRKVLAVDLDQQGNLSRRLGITGSTPIDYTSADVLRGDADPAPESLPTPKPGVSVLVGATDLTDLETAPPADLVTSLRFVALDAWDDVVIDTPPSAGALMQAGVVVADVIVAPVECATEAWEQLIRLEEILGKRLRRIIPSATVSWVIPTKYDGRRRLDREVVESLRARYGEKVTHTIRETVHVKDSYTAGQSVREYAPAEDVAADYTAVVNQILGEER